MQIILLGCGSNVVVYKDLLWVLIKLGLAKVFKLQTEKY